jgi:hypothetical protein
MEMTPLETAVLELLRRFYPESDGYEITEGVDDVTRYIIHLLGPLPKEKGK